MDSFRWKQLRAFAVLPGSVTLLVPAALLHLAGAARCSPPSWAFRLALLGPGIVLLVFGIGLMAQTIRLFARSGRGTLAPWDPTQKLVVHGVYRYVRNPMITGVMLVLLGEAALFASLALLGWFLVFALTNVVYIPIYEEPGLELRFGAAFLEYQRQVPRWLPRRRPWTPPGDT